MFGFLKIFLNLFVQVMSALLLIYCVLSWVVPPDNTFRQKVEDLINPLLNPIRSVLPSFGMFDFSPIVLMVILEFIGSVLSKLL